MIKRYQFETVRIGYNQPLSLTDNERYLILCYIESISDQSFNDGHLTAVETNNNDRLISDQNETD